MITFKKEWIKLYCTQQAFLNNTRLFDKTLNWKSKISYYEKIFKKKLRVMATLDIYRRGSVLYLFIWAPKSLSCDTFSRLWHLVFTSSSFNSICFNSPLIAHVDYNFTICSATFSKYTGLTKVTTRFKKLNPFVKHHIDKIK